MTTHRTANRMAIIILVSGFILSSFNLPGRAAEDAVPKEISARKSISLNGSWAFSLDPEKIGEKERWANAEKVFPDKIDVPSTWQFQGFGSPKGILRHHYEGPAWYKKTIYIPADAKGKTSWLKIGGASRTTKTYVNGKPIGDHDGFLTPFRMDISDAINPGADNVIALCVDNSTKGPTGCFNYLGNWGGVYRPVEIEMTDDVWIDDVFAIPEVDRQQVRLKITVNSKKTDSANELRLKAAVAPRGEEGAKSAVAETTVRLGELHELETEIVVPLSDIKLWFPETPNLYVADVSLSGDGILDSQKIVFGMRTIDWSHGRLTINGQPYFLRGYGDDYVEMITGLPPASKEFFAKRFTLTKSYGFNDVRFHSNAPFEECFQAADESGMFIQAELPAVYMEQLLANKSLLEKDLVRILKAYRNHPSLFSLTLGNEFWTNELNGWPEPKKQEFLDTIRQFYELAKKIDPTRPILSNSGDPTLTPTDIHSGVWLTNDRPFICHEYGEYRGSLPDLALQEKFTGLFAPYSGTQAHADWVKKRLSPGEYAAVLKNSQVLFEIGRKNYLELARKNPQIDGYNYWLITDFPGGIEGDAWYYGVFDQFWNPKQATPESMRKINSVTVVLLDADFGNRCLWSDQERTFKILASHFGHQPIEGGNLSWRLVARGKTLAQGDQAGVNMNVGEVKEIAVVKIGPLDLPIAETLELTVELKEPQGTHANSWTLWAFPRDTSKTMNLSVACQQSIAGSLAALDNIKPFNLAENPKVLIAAELDAPTRRYLHEGGTVILFPKKGTLPGQFDFPLFLRQRSVGPGTVIGDDEIFHRFPNDGFCDGQFLSLMETGTAVNADTLPAEIVPTVWGILPRQGEIIKLFHGAMVFSGRVEKGKILVCTFDVLGNLDEKHPEAFYLLQALIDRAASGNFSPQIDLKTWIENPASPK